MEEEGSQALQGVMLHAGVLRSRPTLLLASWWMLMVCALWSD
jgi:hypothetical protein